MQITLRRVGVLSINLKQEGPRKFIVNRRYETTLSLQTVAAAARGPAVQRYINNLRLFIKPVCEFITAFATERNNEAFVAHIPDIDYNCSVGKRYTEV